MKKMYTIIILLITVSCLTGLIFFQAMNPKIEYRDKLIYRYKTIYQDKIVYKDKIIYQMTEKQKSDLEIYKKIDIEIQKISMIAPNDGVQTTELNWLKDYQKQLILEGEENKKIMGGE